LIFPIIFPNLFQDYEGNNAPEFGKINLPGNWQEKVRKFDIVFGGKR